MVQFNSKIHYVWIKASLWCARVVTVPLLEALMRQEVLVMLLPEPSEENSRKEVLKKTAAQKVESTNILQTVWGSDL